MVSLEETVLHVKPQEEFTIYQVEAFVSKIMPLIPSAKSLHVELVNTDKIDTAGFQVLIALKKSCEVAMIPFVIEGIQGSCENFMELFGCSWNVEAKDIV